MATKGVPYSWEIFQPDANDASTDILRYSSIGALLVFPLFIMSAQVFYSTCSMVSIMCFLYPCKMLYCMSAANKDSDFLILSAKVGGGGRGGEGEGGEEGVHLACGLAR